jgi:hypothetical protein
MCMCRAISPTSDIRAEIQMRSGHLWWAGNGQGSEVIDLQRTFRLTIGAPTSTVHGIESVIITHQSARISTVKRSGHYCRWKESPSSLDFGVTILRKYHCSSLCNLPSQPANNLRIDGTTALRRSMTRRIVKGLCPLRGRSTERSIEATIKYGAVFAEVRFSTWRLAEC